MSFTRKILLCFLLLYSIHFANALNNQWTVQNMFLIPDITNVIASPNGKLAAFSLTKFKKTPLGLKPNIQISIVNLATHKTVFIKKGLTDVEKLQWAPNGKSLYFLAKTANIHNIDYILLPQHKIEQLTHSKTDIKHFQVSPDGKKLACVKANDDSTPSLLEPIIVGTKLDCDNIWIVPSTNLKNEISSIPPLTQFSNANTCLNITNLAWLPNGKSLAYSYVPANQHAIWSHGKISIINIPTKTIHELNHFDMVQHHPIYSPDGKWLAYTSQLRVYIVSMKTGGTYALTKTPDEQPTLIGWSADSKKVYVLETYHTYTAIFSLTINENTINLISPPNKLIQNVSINGKKQLFAFTMQDSQHPIAPYVSDLLHFYPERISQNNKNTPLYPLGKTKIIHWQAKDGVKIQGLLTYPVDYQPGKHYPLIVEIHGGPGGVFYQRYIARRSVFPIAVFAANGYAYFRPNIRGSSGYGLPFRNLNKNDWGGQDYHDILSGINTLIKMGIVDPNRIGIQGWSYGGYMTAWAITQTHLFKAAVIGAGITDLISYAGTNDLPHFVPDALGGYFWQQPELYFKRSPILFVQNVSAPTLIEYGEKDIRVPKSQGFEFYNALKLRHIKTKMLIYPDSKHAIKKPQLILKAAEADVAWFNQYLK